MVAGSHGRQFWTKCGGWYSQPPLMVQSGGCDSQPPLEVHIWGFAYTAGAALIATLERSALYRSMTTTTQTLRHGWEQRQLFFPFSSAASVASVCFLFLFFLFANEFFLIALASLFPFRLPFPLRASLIVADSYSLSLLPISFFPFFSEYKSIWEQ